MSLSKLIGDGQGSLTCCSLWGHKELDTTEWLNWIDSLWGFPSGSAGKNLLAVQETWETWVWSLGQEDPLEKEMAIPSSILAWKVPKTEEPGRLQSMWSQRVGHHWAHTHTHTHRQRIYNMGVIKCWLIVNYSYLTTYGSIYTWLINTHFGGILRKLR